MSQGINTSRGLVTRIALEARTRGHLLTEYHGDCSSPSDLHLFGYPDKVLVGLGIEPDRAVAQHMTVRCRKCPECLRHRGRLWAARAHDEVLASRRTWFATLTLAPDRALQARYAALPRISDASGRYGSEADLFQAMAQFVGPELTRWLKRIRKNSGASLRYLLVCEAHKSGVPHWHALIHEYSDQAVTKRQLEKSWSYGFSKFKLIDGDEQRAAWYVCKYLAKSALTRVRASKKYGDVQSLLTERIATLMRDVSGNGASPPRTEERKELL